MHGLKKHKGFIIGGVITLIATIALLVVHSSRKSASRAAQQEFQDLDEMRREVTTSPYAPTDANIKQLDVNLAFVKETRIKVLEEIHGKYQQPKAVARMTAIEASNEMFSRISLLTNILADKGIDSSLAPAFGFEAYQAALPRSEAIGPLMKQLEIVNAIMTLIEIDGTLNAINMVKLPTEIQLMERRQYKYYTVDVAVTGPLRGVRNLVNALNEAEYFFVVRDITFSFHTLPRSAHTRDPDVVASLGQRKVYRDENRVTATLEIDYIEFESLDE